MPRNPQAGPHRAQAELLRHRKRALDSGAVHFGWKIGINDPRARRFYGLEDSVVGYMTRDSLLSERREFEAGALLVAEPELAIRVTEEIEPGSEESAIEGAIGEVAPALEVLDFNRPRRTLHEVMSHNIFHLGVGLGEWMAAEPSTRTFVECLKNGEVAASARAPQALPPLERIVGLVARTLGAHGEKLFPGDVIISGAMTPAIPIEAGQELSVVFSGLGRVGLSRDDGGGLTFSALRPDAV